MRKLAVVERGPIVGSAVANKRFTTYFGTVGKNSKRATQVWWGGVE